MIAATQATREAGMRLGRVIARATSSKCTTNIASTNNMCQGCCGQLSANAMSIPGMAASQA